MVSFPYAGLSFGCMLICGESDADHKPLSIIFTSKFRVFCAIGPSSQLDVTHSYVSTCIYYSTRLTLVFDYMWFTEYQNSMETNSSRAPFGDLTNQTNGGN